MTLRAVLAALAVAVAAGPTLAQHGPGLGPFGGGLSDDERTQLAEQRFAAADANGDGQLTAEELVAAAVALEQLRREERVARLIEMLVDGRVEPRDVGRLMATLEAGYLVGMERQIGVPQTIPPAEFAFAPMPESPHRHIARCGWRLSRGMRRALRDTRAATSLDGVTSLIRFGLNARFHKVRFRMPGYWEQTGGLYGRSERNQPIVQAFTPKSRCAVELQRILPYREPGTR